MDRGFDPVAPIIHDWTYEPMVYDLLAPEGATYRYHSENNRGAATAGQRQRCFRSGAHFVKCADGSVTC